MERCALITGCSSGIGRATALAFIDEEWDVVATARDEADVVDLADRGCVTAELDVTDPTAVHDVVESTVDKRGRIDCLVNNAGYSQVGALEDVPASRLHRQFDVNVYGPHRMTRAVLPHMRRREDGTIVNISSVQGRISLPGTGPYAASKFALEAMSDALRAEVDPHGIDVVVIEPGPVATEFKRRAGREVETIEHSHAYEDLYGLIEDWRALGDAGSVSPTTVADAIVNAASATDPEPRYVIGSIGAVGSIARFVPGSVRDSLYRLLLKAAAKRRE